MAGLSQAARTVYLALDADRAGQEAMLRAAGAAREKQLELLVVDMPEGKDPADLLAGGDGASASAFREAIESAEDLPVFHVHTLLDDADLSSPSGRDRALDEVVGVIAAMPDSISREELMREFADRFDADPALVGRRAAAAGTRRATPAAQYDDPGPDSQRAPAAETRALNARELRESALLAMCVRLPAEGEEYIAKLSDAHFSRPVAVRAWRWLRDRLADPMEGLDRSDEELYGYITDVKMRAEEEPASGSAMELNFLELERAKVDDEIAVAPTPPVELQRERARITERIARAQS
jgi:DNA primase